MRVHTIAWIAIFLGFIALAFVASFALVTRLMFVIYDTINEWAFETWELAKDMVECAYKEARDE
jgi:hypothetical protein